MATVGSYSAVEGSNGCILFYVRASDGAIAYASSSTGGLETRDTTYSIDTLQVVDNPIVPSIPRISAVRWWLNGLEEIRLYYIRSGPDGVQLRELGRTGGSGGEWFTANKLDAKRIVTARDSSLSACLEWNTHTIKVYFQRPNGKPAVAFAEMPTSTGVASTVVWDHQDLQTSATITPML